jgi:predicted hotdog family 3-hydroxylacyl-ACP dehydratase
VDPEAWYAQEDGSMPAWFGLELMAQTIGAYSGSEARAKGEAPRLGYVLGTQSYRPSIPAFPAGAKLEISAEMIFQDPSGLFAFACEIHHAGEPIVQSTLKVYQKP